MNKNVEDKSVFFQCFFILCFHFFFSVFYGHCFFSVLKKRKKHIYFTVLRGQAPVSFSSQARGARSKQGGLEPSQAEAMSPKMHHRESNLRAQREQISNSNTKQPCHLPATKSHLHRNLIQNCFGD